jgi:hypothetical protein
MVPKDHSMWKSFMEDEKVPGKCLVRMKIEELYRDVSIKRRVARGTVFANMLTVYL